MPQALLDPPSTPLPPPKLLNDNEQIQLLPTLCKTQKLVAKKYFCSTPVLFQGSLSQQQTIYLILQKVGWQCWPEEPTRWVCPRKWSSSANIYLRLGPVDKESEKHPQTNPIFGKIKHFCRGNLIQWANICATLLLRDGQLLCGQMFQQYFPSLPKTSIDFDQSKNMPLPFSVPIRTLWQRVQWNVLICTGLPVASLIHRATWKLIDGVGAICWLGLTCKPSRLTTLWHVTCSNSISEYLSNQLGGTLVRFLQKALWKGQMVSRHWKSGVIVSTMEGGYSGSKQMCFTLRSGPLTINQPQGCLPAYASLIRCQSFAGTSQKQALRGSLILWGGRLESSST